MFCAGWIVRSITSRNLLSQAASIFRPITSSTASLDCDKYRHLWSDDFHCVYLSKMPKSKEYLSSSDDSSSNDSGEKPKKKQKKEKVKEEKAESSKKKPVNKADEEEPYWELGSNKRIKVREWKGKLYIDIREMYEKDGKLLPGKKGIALNFSQFEELMKVINEVDEVAKIKRGQK